MSDISDLTKLFSDVEVDPYRPECQVNRLAEKFADFAIQDTEIAGQTLENEAASWPQIGRDNDEFLRMAGFDLLEFQNDESPYDDGLVAAGVDLVAFREQNDHSEWNNFVNQIEEIEHTQEIPIASYKLYPNHCSLPCSDDGMLQSMASYLSSLPPMAQPMAPIAPNSTEALIFLPQRNLICPSSGYKYDHWVNSVGNELADVPIPASSHELERISLWMAEEIWKRIKQDAHYYPPFSPKAHPFYPFWLSCHPSNTTIIAHARQQALGEISKTTTVTGTSEAVEPGVVDVADEM